MPLPKEYQWTKDWNVSEYAPPTREERDFEIQEYKANDEVFKEWDWENPQKLGPQGEALPELAIGWKPTGEADFGTGFKGWWNKAVSNVRSAWETGYQEGIKISGVTQYAIKKTQGEEKGTETIEAMQEARKPKDQNTAYWTASLEASKEMFNQALWGGLELLGQPAVFAEQAIGTAGQTLGRALGGEEIDRETLKRDWDASRLAYSSIFDASIYAEMNRRLDAGIRPDLAAQEIMIDKKWTLWPELIGQIAFDPLDVISVWGKAGQAAKLEKSVAKTFSEIANPETARVWNAAGEAIQDMDNAKAFQLFDELAESYDNVVATAEKELDEFSNTYKASSLTRDGKVAHVANQTGEILMHVVNNAGDEAPEILLGMKKLASKDKAVRAEGFATIFHFADPISLLSEAGQNTSVMLGKMFEKYGDNWLSNIEKLKGDPVALTKDLLTKLDSVGEEMFPSVSSILKAEEAVKAGGVIDDATRALAERAAQLPPSVRAATKFHDAAQKVVGPLNKAFAGAYMGWNPGYAFRNYTNNTMQILIDHGPGVLLGKADDLIGKAERMHGGVLQGKSGFGGQLASLFPKTDEAKKGLSLTHGPSQILAEKLEENAAKRIIGKTYMNTFEKGTKALTKAITNDLKAAGFSDDIIKKLPTYILQNDGDATKVIAALRADISSGVIDLFNDVSRIDPKYKSFLSDAGKWDEYSETVLKATSKEEATAAAKKIFDDLAQAGDYAYRDARPAVGVDDQFLKMAEKGGLTETRGQLISIRRSQNESAIKAAESILSDADDMGASMGLQVGTMKKARGITGLNTWGNDAAKETRRINDIALKLYQVEAKKGTVNFNQLWMAYPELFPGTPPKNLDYRTFVDALWTNYDDVVSKMWGGARDTAIDSVTGYLDDLKGLGAPIKDEWYEIIKQAQEGAQQFDNVVIGRNGEMYEEANRVANRVGEITRLAQKYGISSATEAGVPADKKLLAIINKYGDTSFKSLNDPIDLNLVDEAFKKKAGVVEGAEQAAETAVKGNRILPPTVDGEAPTAARAIFEQKDGIKKIETWMLDDIEKNFGKKQLVDQVTESAMQKAEKELTQKLAETRLISSRVAQANRDFTLLNYGEKSYRDVALAYLYPFHFWYGRTYKNWLSRVASNPSILAHYSRYKENLATVHADMPEWWKYNINTNDLPGVDMENPLYFNLEATLWPLNGLTNTDFNDPSKRVGFWTYLLDYANKFGPSTWTPINMVTGLALYNQGEKEAGERWMGRLFPQSSTIKAAGSLLGITNLETDPFVNFLQGGLDPYERRRVGRALAALEQEGLYTSEQIQDAAYSQQGEIWDEAVKRSVRGRAGSQISSFMLGVGFKGRTAEDQQVDKFYTDYNKLWTMRPNLSPEEFREGMDTLHSKYSFMDAVLLSRRSGVERDAGLAYNVLQRIPPGKSSEISKAAGIDPALMDKFFSDKGQIDQWSAADQKKFMSGVLNIAAVLEIPPDTTKAEWTQAKNAYSGLTNEAKKKFGGNILDMVDGYFQAKTKSSDAANAYLDKHPEVSSYMDWKAQRVMNSPLLSAYYGGASQIEGYYRGKMYDDIESKLGKEIFDVISEYNDLKTYGNSRDVQRFYSQNKARIKKYYSMKEDWQVTINQETAKLSSHLPEGQGAGIREDYDSTSVTTQNLVNSLQPQQQMTYEDFASVVPDRLMNLVNDYFYSGDRLPESAEKQLSRLAGELGYPDTDALLQAIGASMYEMQP